MGRLNLSNMDTTPGKNNPFSPPAEWTGNRDEYIALMKEKKETQESFQQFYVAAKQNFLYKNVEFSGPYKDIAHKLFTSFCSNLSNNH